MKTMKYISLRVLAIAALALAFAMPAKAQLSDNGYANVDWQFNAPLKNHFADKASGWGMNFEGGYFVTPNLGLGLFMNYSSNHEYFPRATFPVGEGTVNTDQQHTIFQLPFGAAARYQMNRGGAWQPYFGVKLGANYAKVRSNYNMFEKSFILLTILSFKSWFSTSEKSQATSAGANNTALASSASAICSGCSLK